jgi:hypothetical protein
LGRTAVVLSVRDRILSIFCFPHYVAMVAYIYVPLLVVMPFQTQALEIQPPVFSAVNLSVAPPVLVMPPAKGQIFARLVVRIFIFFLAATSNLCYLTIRLKLILLFMFPMYSVLDVVRGVCDGAPSMAPSIAPSKKPSRKPSKANKSKKKLKRTKKPKALKKTKKPKNKKI